MFKLKETPLFSLISLNSSEGEEKFKHDLKTKIPRTKGTWTQKQQIYNRVYSKHQFATSS